MIANEIYPPIKEKYPNIEWRAFTRIRNRIAHHYPTLRDKEMFGFVKNHVLPLEKEFALS